MDLNKIVQNGLQLGKLAGIDNSKLGSAQQNLPQAIEKAKGLLNSNGEIDLATARKTIQDTVGLDKFKGMINKANSMTGNPIVNFALKKMGIDTTKINEVVNELMGSGNVPQATVEPFSVKGNTTVGSSSVMDRLKNLKR